MRTLPFQLKGLELARILGMEYVRSFWFVIVGVPIFGVIALALAPNDLVRYFGVVCLMWPITIPGRAAFLARKSARLYREETIAAIEEGELRLYRPSGKGSRVDLAAIRGVGSHSEALVVRTRSLAMVVIPQSAFASQQDREAFRAALRPGTLPD